MRHAQKPDTISVYHGCLLKGTQWPSSSMGSQKVLGSLCYSSLHFGWVGEGEVSANLHISKTISLNYKFFAYFGSYAYSINCFFSWTSAALSVSNSSFQATGEGNVTFLSRLRKGYQNVWSISYPGPFNKLKLKLLKFFTSCWVRCKITKETSALHRLTCPACTSDNSTN